MNKNKILVTLIVLLLLANVAWLFLYMKKGKHPGREGRRMDFYAQLKNEVGFSDAQVKQMQQLREQHRAQQEPLLDSMAKLRGEIFDRATNTDNDSAVNRNIMKIVLLQQEMEKKWLTDIREVKKICTPQQTPKFDSLMKKTMMMFGRGRKKGMRG
jgi:Spy/CpxP family protein refolding chaperone